MDEIYTDGSYINPTGKGGWAAVLVRHSTGRKVSGSSVEMELRGLIEGVKLAEGPSTIVTDHQDIVNIARKGKVAEHYKELWQELYAACERKDIQFAWSKRNQTLGSRLAHQLARDEAKGRG